MPLSTGQPQERDSSQFAQPLPPRPFFLPSALTAAPEYFAFLLFLLRKGRYFCFRSVPAFEAPRPPGGVSKNGGEAEAFKHTRFIASTSIPREDERAHVSVSVCLSLSPSTHTRAHTPLS